MQSRRTLLAMLLNFKARLTVKGFSQVHGLDFYDTYAPVADYSSVRLFLVVIVEFGLFAEVRYKTAYLTPNLKYRIFMKQPEGYDDKSGNVFELFKTLYGLKQGAHDWSETLDNFIVNITLRTLHLYYNPLY